MKKIIISLIILALGYIIGISSNNSISLGSVTNDGIYSNITLTSTNASTTSAISIRGGSGILGSIVVASSTNKAISIYDGNATTTGSATLITTLPAGATAGTYTFDINVVRGITVGGVAGFNGVYNVTYR